MTLSSPQLHFFPFSTILPVCVQGGHWELHPASVLCGWVCGTRVQGKFSAERQSSSAASGLGRAGGGGCG